MNLSAYSFFQYKDTLAPEWDDFVNQQDTGSIHQISKWKKFQESIPGREIVLGFGLRDPNHKIIATTWCVKMNTGFLGKFWFYSARGPVFATANKSIQTHFLKLVSKELKKESGIFWRLDPYFTDEDWSEIRKEIKLKEATKNFQPTDALMLDLELSEEEILAQMKRTGRRNLKIAQKSDLTIESISPEKLTQKDVEDFYSLNTETTTRDKFSGHEASYYKHFIEKLAPMTQLYFVATSQTRIAAAITTFCDKKAIYYFGASTSKPEYRDLRAPYALQWKMILDAKARGCNTYDFTGITPADQPNHPYAGITQFKTRFGGYRSTFASGKEIPLNNFWYTIYRTVKKLKS